MLSGGLIPFPGLRVRQANFTVEIVSTLPELESLWAEWQELYQRSPQATPFQSPAWLIPWARHFAPDRTQAIAVRRARTLIALIPFFTWQGSVLLAGTGPTDYIDGLFANDDDRVGTAVLTALSNAADELSCTAIDMQQLRPDSPLLTAPPPRGWRSAVEDGALCPVTPLCGASGLARVSQRLQKNLAQCRRRIDSLRGHVTQLHISDDPEPAARTLERLHASRWEQRGEPGVLNASLMQRFLRDALRESSLAGMLRFHTLEIQGNTVAALLAVQGHEAAYFYLSGFDPAWSRISPGMVTIAAAMTTAAGEGAREFHFLRGREPYKYRLGAADRSTVRRMLTRLS